MIPSGEKKLLQIHNREKQIENTQEKLGKNKKNDDLLSEPSQKGNKRNLGEDKNLKNVDKSKDFNSLKRDKKERIIWLDKIGKSIYIHGLIAVLVVILFAYLL